MAPKSVTFRRHDHLVSVLFGDWLTHWYTPASPAVKLVIVRELVACQLAIVIELRVIRESVSSTACPFLTHTTDGGE